LYNAYENKLDDKESKNKLKTEFNLLLAKINYDVNRKNSKVPKEMYEFVKFNKEKVFDEKNDVKDRFKVFRKHFETVVAYSVGQLKD
jgi:CRISPR type III-A-associated protein Csm2